MSADDQQADGGEQADGDSPGVFQFDLITGELNPDSSPVTLVVEGGQNGGIDVTVYDAGDSRLPCCSFGGVKHAQFGDSTWQGTVGNKIRDDAVLPSSADPEAVKKTFIRVCSGIYSNFEENYADVLKSRDVERILEATADVRKRKGERATVTVVLERNGERTEYEFSEGEWRSGSDADGFCDRYWGQFCDGNTTVEEVEIADDEEWDRLRDIWEREYMTVSAEEEASSTDMTVRRALEYLRQTVSGDADLSAMDTDHTVAFVDPDPNHSDLKGPVAFLGLEVIHDALETVGKDTGWSGTLSHELQERGVMAGGSRECRGDKRLWPFVPYKLGIDAEVVLSEDDEDDGDDDIGGVIGA